MHKTLLSRLFILAATVAACSTSPTDNSPAPGDRALRMEAVTLTFLSGIVGDEVASPLTVRVTETTGAPAAGIHVSFTLTGGGHITNTWALTDGNGEATVQAWTLGIRPGISTVVARAAGLREITFTAEAKTGPVAALLVFRGDSQAGNSGSALEIHPVVRVVDRYSNPVANVPVVFDVLSGDGTVQFPLALSNANGDASPGAWTLGSSDGTQEITARALGFSVVLAARACSIACQAQQLMFVSNGRFYKVNIGGVVTPFGGAGKDHDPSWSHNAARIAFTRFSGTVPAVYIINANGTGERLIGDGFHSPSWSPDNRRLAVARGDCVYFCETFVLDADDPLAAPVRLAHMAASPAWSPDGKSIAYILMSGDDGYHSVRLVNADGSNDRPLTTMDAGGMSELAWSPDSRTIAFDKCMAGACNIYLVAAYGGEVRPLTHLGNAFGGVSWSPDGSRISFTTFNSTYRFSVHVVDAVTGGNAVSLGEGSDPVWIPTPPMTTVRSLQPPR